MGSETVSYDALGNILSKTDVGSGSYRYGESHCGVQAGPHAVTYVPGKGNYCYDQNGNMTSGDSRTVQYTAFNKPERIQQGGEIATLFYGPDRSRFKRTDSGTQNRVTYYIGAYEKELRDGHTYHRIQLGDFAIVEKQDNQAETLQYTLRDDLGSLIGTVSETGEIKRLHFDPWGKRVEYAVPNVQATDLLSLANFITDRGFTGHEHMDNVGLIHMNGRVYDPEIARFVSADPVIQAPTYLQSFNRYTYTWNNPLRMTDPSGFRNVEFDPQTDDKVRREELADKRNGGTGHSDTRDREHKKHDDFKGKKEKEYKKKIEYIMAYENNVRERLEKYPPVELDSFALGVADLVGKIWALPNTVFGVAWGSFGYVVGNVGYALGVLDSRPTISFGNNAIQFHDHPFMSAGSGFTLGNVITYGVGAKPNRGGAYGDISVNFGLHEAAHTYQYQTIGIFYVPVYFLNGGFSGPSGNPLEKAAQNFGSGRGDWWVKGR